MGALPDLDRRPLRFGVFELDAATGELRKHGIRVRLQEQPFKLLLCLIEAPGEIRTREDRLPVSCGQEVMVFAPTPRMTTEGPNN